MRFQDRDGEMLKAIYDNDGILARRQLKKLFWPDKSWRAMEQRLAKLFQAGFLNWPSKDQYKKYPVPEAFCWLGWQGAIYISGLQGIYVDPPDGANEYRLRLLEGKLRKKGFRWVREPRWSLLEHDLALIDFRLALEQALKNVPTLTLEKWLPESKFRAFKDTVVIENKTVKGQDVPIKKYIFPDGYFEIVDEQLQQLGEPSKMRFLLELDMGTHDTLRFGREKVVPGIHYIKSQVYKSRFNSNSGYWLVISKGGSERMKHLLTQIDKNGGNYAHLFFLASMEELRSANPLTAAVWHQVGSAAPRSLL